MVNPTEWARAGLVHLAAVVRGELQGMANCASHAGGLALVHSTCTPAFGTAPQHCMPAHLARGRGLPQVAVRVHIVYGAMTREHAPNGGHGSCTRARTRTRWYVDVQG